MNTFSAWAFREVYSKQKSENRLLQIVAQSTFPVIKLEAGYILPKVFNLWDKVPSGSLQ